MDIVWTGKAAEKALYYHSIRPVMRWEAPDPKWRESIEAGVTVEDDE